ncbi:MAG TPA: hypothetical protein VGO45_06650, partial [Bacteroidia bacterium]|nr:hypothetical protein [Bacteroidia bacterium]
MTELPEIQSQQPKKRSRLRRFVSRLLLVLLIMLVVLTGTGFILAWKYQDEAKALVISKLNEQLNTQVIILPKDIDFSVLRNFPNASVDFRNVKMLDAVQTDGVKDTLIKAGTISLQFNIRDIFNKHYVIKRIDLEDVIVNIWVSRDGKDNFHFLKTSADTSTVRDTSAFSLDKILMKNIHVKYKNSKTKDNYEFTLRTADLKGHFNSQNYTLETDLTLFVDHIRNNKTVYIQNRNVVLATELDVTGGKYTIKKAELSLGKL